MTEQEYLLSVVIEECAEVQQRATKALRFGMDETQPGQPHDNATRFWGEVQDLQASLEMLATHRGMTEPASTREGLDAKKARVRHFMRYSESLGTLQRSGKIAG